MSVPSVSLFWSYLAIVAIVAILGNFIMGNLRDQWYQNLNKPNFQPPPWVFTLMWTLIYLSLAYVVYRANTLAITEEKRTLINIVFAINLILTLAWSYFFSRQHNLRMGLIIIILLIISVVTLMAIIYPLDHSLPLWLSLYLVWLFIALYLNWQYIQLNP